MTRIDEVVLETALEGLIEAHKMALAANASPTTIRTITACLWQVAGGLPTPEAQSLVKACAETLSVLEPTQPEERN